MSMIINGMTLQSFFRSQLMYTMNSTVKLLFLRQHTMDIFTHFSYYFLDLHLKFHTNKL